MEVLISFTAEVAKFTVVPIGREAGYLLLYKSNFKKLEDCVKELDAARITWNHCVEDERRNGKEIEAVVVNWLKDANELIEKANKLREDPHHANVRCSIFPFPNLILRHQLSRKATKISKEAVDIQGKAKFPRIAYLPTPDEITFSYSSTTRRLKLENRELFKDKILKALQDLNANSIGVYGLDGAGKTTVVEEIAEIAKHNKLFDAVVMANVSRYPDIRRIQGEISDQLKFTFTEETIVGRASRLKQKINEKNILVILDDIWPAFELDKLGIPLGDERTSRIQNKQNTKQNVKQNIEQYVCKLLMTSSNKEVLLAKEVEEEFTFRLELLSELETWHLFQFMVGDTVKDISLQSLAPQVAQKCAGLPLLIVTVARGLKNKDIHVWEYALRQLESNSHAGMDMITRSTLELSYNLLVSEEMKDIFLLSSTLQDSDAEYLLKVAMGLNIFKNINTVYDARNTLHNIILSLRASCLLDTCNTSGQIQMNNYVRDVAVSIALRDRHVFVKENLSDLKEWPTKDFRRSSQIILHGCNVHKLPQRLDCPNAKFFYLDSADSFVEISNTVFEGMESLQVLDLTRLHLSPLPTSFQSLSSLQTLCLDQCVLENMDAIGALRNLEILSLVKSSMIKLPSEIEKLTKLRMLDLSHSGIEVIPPNIISSLTTLEELYLGNTPIKWEEEYSAKQNKNASLAELRQLSNLTALELQIPEIWVLPRDLKLMFEKLKKFKIAIGEVWEWDEMEMGNLNTLMLKLGTSIHLEHGIKALIKRVENLYLDEVDDIQNVLFQLNWEGFPLLKLLHIQNNAKMKHIVDSKERNTVQVCFVNLEKLVLENLKNLERICHGRLEVNSFGKLSVIKVNNCVQLKHLLSYSMVKGLSHLSDIEVCQCTSMTEIILEDRDPSADNDMANEKIEFPSLHSLSLEHLPKLGNFFAYESKSSTNERKYQRLEMYVPALFFGAQVFHFALIYIEVIYIIFIL